MQILSTRNIWNVFFFFFLHIHIIWTYSGYVFRYSNSLDFERMIKGPFSAAFLMWALNKVLRHLIYCIILGENFSFRTNFKCWIYYVEIIVLCFNCCNLHL